MHIHILGAGLWAAGAAFAAQAVAPAACPTRDAAVVEQFISADCPDCWAAAAPVAAAGQWRLDWISPTSVEAPLSAAALVESAERAQRAGGPAPVAQQMLTTRSRLAPPPQRLSLSVAVGPAWHGYFGVQADIGGSAPPDSTLWLALVEAIPAGSDHSQVARELVRSVAGPLTTSGPAVTGKIRPKTFNHLRAMRWPDIAQAERLQARAWLEAADGSLLAFASPPCPWR